MSTLHRLAVLALIVLIFPTAPVHALSCMPYSPVQAFLDAQASPDRYIIVHGRIELNPADLPEGGIRNLEKLQPDNFLPASVTGFSLTGSGYNARFVRQIRVNAQCYASWCASLRPGMEYLVFLKKENGYLLEINPCGGMAFAEPDAVMLNKIHECLLGEECLPPPLRR